MSGPSTRSSPTSSRPLTPFGTDWSTSPPTSSRPDSARMPLSLGGEAPPFADLHGTDGKRYSLSSFDDKPLLAVLFASNGCPTVRAFEPQLIDLQSALA